MDCDIPSRLTPSSLSRVLLVKKGIHFQKIFFIFFQCGDVENTKVSRHFGHTFSLLLRDAVIIFLFLPNNLVILLADKCVPAHYDCCCFIISKHNNRN